MVDSIVTREDTMRKVGRFVGDVVWLIGFVLFCLFVLGLLVTVP